MSEFLVEAARSSPAIAASLSKLRQRAEAAIRDAAIADTVLDARDSAPHPTVPRGSDSATVIPREHAQSAAHDFSGSREVKSWSADLLRDVAAPDVFASNPLGELELLALRSAQALRTQGSRLRQVTIVVAGLAAAIVGAGLYAAVQGEYGLAGGLVAGGLVVLALVIGKWNPFRRAARSAELAELADATATTLRLRMRALAELGDSKTRALEQWKVVIEMTESVRRRRP
ncbi:hypothetical protein SAMN02745121_01373 [Nannocystis exedens]|uniref:Uncharacterized protein n=1 Tax=Nannocystis exedens TaxID=54 RepID=A0A1I1UXI8_9BACT|nr:hypothetical protein [Nannocystis exedens]PCC72164.1 hypothetical protein NAEX_05243 [Nannocystis exedens]SFD75349.1 hypothetical protein SAMN02745121_01373 [Nannocystis exedens]